ncbi:MAG: hypothetical protein DWQ37_16430 [Planctomycetota bacterium]|nr:MAG: hypothetical protein DWQ37_16430 [Planctomycetota bacterium]
MASADQPHPGPEETAPADAVSSIRWWPLRAIIAVVVALVSLLQLAPGEALPEQFRNFGSIVLVAAGIVALFVWLVLFSRIPVRARAITAAIYLVVLAIPFAVVRRVEFTGDIVPDPVFRWDPEPLEILQQHRRQVREETSPETSGPDLAADFPAFRGEDRLGIYRGPAIRTNWESEPPKLVWRQPVGEGYAQFALSGNTAVTIEQRGPDEAIVAYDARDGRERWVHAYPARFSEAMGGDGPRATPTIDGDRVYSLGAKGHLKCLKLASGDVVWETNILADPEANLEWGMAGSPLVLDDVVIVNPGMPQAAAKGSLVAYDKQTGKVEWKVGDATAAYASPQYAELAGVPQILTLEGAAVVSYAADGSAELWRYPWSTANGINCSQPLPVGDDRVLITAGYVMGSALLEIARDDEKGWSAEPLWEEASLRGKFATPIVVDDVVFGLDEGILVCVDLETGKRLWKRGRYGHGQMLLAGDVLFIQCENGDMALVAADPKKYRELARIPVFEERTWNTPALAAGRAFIRNHREMACFDLRESPEE